MRPFLDFRRPSFVRPTTLLTMLLAVLVTATSAWAAPKGPYTDTKKRFEISLAGGWELAPLPGDGFGMNFRRIVAGVPASLHVMVEKAGPGQTVQQTLDKAEAGFKAEIGYNPGTDVPVTIGAMSGVRRSLSVFASGDRTTVRSVELYVLHAFGHAHVLHFETLEKSRGTFTRDLDRMLASYVPMAGRELVAPLSGVWLNTGGGPDLTLDDSGAFRMGPLSGGWQADGGRLVLQIPSGAERYQYVQSGDTLTLSSPNLGGDLVFRRSSNGAAKRVPDGPVKPVRSGAVTREELIGTWSVLDQAATEPLTLQLASSGSVAFGGLSGRWRFSTGRLTITSTQGSTITYAASMTNGHLVLSGGDLDKEITFDRL
jgi:hypothetical protein